MNEQIQQRIIENLQHLNSFQLSNTLDFIEFLRYRRRNPLAHNKQKEFKAKEKVKDNSLTLNCLAEKQDISLLPKRRLGKIENCLSREYIYENER
ncbi:hypothetical protein QUF80_10860 [Desulfococcaceae bacterium HSG8]|nr:hypothetical protein [Desulfococcaceae bacterium HSG8]